jgi:hypothetical protein
VRPPEDYQQLCGGGQRIVLFAEESRLFVCCAELLLHQKGTQQQNNSLRRAWAPHSVGVVSEEEALAAWPRVHVVAMYVRAHAHLGGKQLGRNRLPVAECIAQLRLPTCAFALLCFGQTAELHRTTDLTAVGKAIRACTPFSASCADCSLLLAS